MQERAKAKERGITRRQESRRTRAEGSRSNSTEESEDKNKIHKREIIRRREQRENREKGRRGKGAKERAPKGQ